MRITDLGVTDFQTALTRQMERVEEVIQGAEPSLFLVEHPPVITLGRSADWSNLLLTPEALEKLGIQLVRIGRGGDITCHYPGQLVAYPIFRLDRRPGGVRRFFSDLEEVVIRVLAGLGVNGERLEGTAGVFVQGRKIASMGIAVKRWVSFHGVSLNLKGNRALFSTIVPCGLTGVSMTSLEDELGPLAPKMPELKEHVIDGFTQVFAQT
ncbi:MAG: lipoyl(octanoyl) transferase LipB [Desulfovibrionales bacterium]